MILSIITPTFNRAYRIPQIYACLQNNPRSQFEWIIVDDGSVDNTTDLVVGWLAEDKINIKYIKQQNKGKTAALVTGFASGLRGTYSLVLDSDDVLVSGFLKILQQDLISVSNDEIGLVYLKSDLEGNIIGSQFHINTGSYIDVYFGPQKTDGDKLFVIKTPIYKNSLVPPFDSEKLIPEGVFYLNMSLYGSLIFKNKVLYAGDYLEDGLSHNVLKLAADNIQGFIFEKQILQKQTLGFKERIKNEIKYISYSFSGDRSWIDILKRSNRKIYTLFLLLPTYIATHHRIQQIKVMRHS
ncbi:glycosyltransferase family A protein [Sphingobacterium spiritivorum]|uniref:glycosyltransferase family A protein n=1 Tax=Sphingobacterium spiritivorum TaxID=258 RepID=UPI003DA270EA